MPFIDGDPRRPKMREPRTAGVCCAVLLFLLPAARGVAFDWPVENRTLTSTFGENRADHFHPGIELGGEQPVFPIADGEVVFYHEDRKGYSSFPRGIGNAVVLQHEGRIQSVYAHLKDGSLRIQQSILQSHGSQPLAVSGDSGAAVGKQLLFMIIDLEENAFLNPVKFDTPLLSPPLQGFREGPVIGRIYLKRGSSLAVLRDNMSVKAGSGELLAEVYDGSTFVSFFRKMAPYRIYLFRNGRMETGVTFDSLRERDGRLILPDRGAGFSELYEDVWIYRLGTVSLVEGGTQIQIKATSHSGAESNVSLQVTVVSE